MISKTGRDHYFNSWAGGILLLVTVPACLWVMFGLLSNQLVDTVLIIFGSIPVHLFLYSVITLPIFKFCWHDGALAIWRLPSAIALGGVAAVLVSLVFLIGGQRALPTEADFLLVGIAFLYGAYSGFIAWVCRKRLIR